MQTQQRKIPLRGVDGTFKTWAEVLVPFQNELNTFAYKIDSLKTRTSQKSVERKSLLPAMVTLADPLYRRYPIDSLSRVFSDTSLLIQSYSADLKNLEGIQTSFRQQLKQGMELQFTNNAPIKVLVGYFNPQRAAFAVDSVFLKAPELETNASANDYGQAETKIANAMVIKGMPAVNVHSYHFEPGKNVLKLPKGVCLILGFIEGRQELVPYDAGLTEGGIKKEIDWLFE
jgi:hypothetical protein